MAAQIVSAKISQELHEKLLAKAAQENRSVSGAVREAITAWVEEKPKAGGESIAEMKEQPKAGGESIAEMKEQLEHVELVVSAALQAVGVVMSAALKESGKAHTYARQAGELVIGVTSELPKNSPLWQREKELKIREWDEVAERYGEQLWDKATVPNKGGES